jgi:hypothetical protein
MNKPTINTLREIIEKSQNIDVSHFVMNLETLKGIKSSANAVDFCLINEILNQGTFCGINVYIDPLYPKYRIDLQSSEYHPSYLACNCVGELQCRTY